MKVLNRNNELVDVTFDQISDRLTNLSIGLTSIDIGMIAQKTINGMYDGIQTAEIDTNSASIADMYKLTHPNYGILASRIEMDNLHKSTPSKFTEFIHLLTESHTRKVEPEALKFIMDNADRIDSMIDHKLDFLFSYNAIKALSGTYLITVGKDKKPLERPQYLYMRVAIVATKHNIEHLKDYYEALANQYFIHATPTLFNSAIEKQQLNSCFLLGMEDSIESIMQTFKNISIISKWAGGIGLHISNIRAAGSLIKGTGGYSNGIVRQMKILCDIMKCWNQGGKRNGSCAVYMEPWHADIVSFLQLRLNNGSEDMRARDLFLALWIPNLFMERLKENKDWTLFSEDTAPHLSDVYDGMDVCENCGWSSTQVQFHSDSPVPTIDYANGLVGCDNHQFKKVDAFTRLYEFYESSNMGRGTMKPAEIMDHAITSQRESGTPYILFKDHVNTKSNQSQIGTIKSSNLCVTPETRVLTDEGYYQICDLANKQVNVWNGFEWSPVIPQRTDAGVQQPIMRVNLSTGTYLDCTYYHKFWIQVAGKATQREAQLLKPGDVLIKYNLPEYVSPQLIQATSTEVPVNSSMNDKISWITKTVEDTDAIKKIGSDLQINMTSLNYEYLTEVRYMLQTLGVDSRIETDKDMHKIQFAALFHHLIVSQKGFTRLVNLGLTIKSKDLSKYRSRLTNSEVERITIESIQHLDRVSDTYCFKEHKRGYAIFNGVLTGQCAEICEVSSPTSYACCVLAGINLKKYWRSTTSYDFESLYKHVRIVTRGLDNTIDINAYPVEECVANSNDWRPLAIGIQGLADVFCLMKVPYDSKKATQLDVEIMETIYWAAINESLQLAIEKGPHTHFKWSPASRGLLQFDLWSQTTSITKFKSIYGKPSILSGRYDWDAIKEKIKVHGLRNSLLIGLMPTAGSSQILSNNESFEPFDANISTRTTINGKQLYANMHMINHLIDAGLWTPQVRIAIENNRGSLSTTDLPREIKDIYKTTWEIKQKKLITRAALRSAFVDQSQSLNIYQSKTSTRAVRKIIELGYDLGLKTGIYYLRSREGSEVIKNNKVTPAKLRKQPSSTEIVGPVCKKEEGCLSCN